MCEGTVEMGLGCMRYRHSDDHDLDSDSEAMLRLGGLGFSVDLDAVDATMSAHLQDAHGLSKDAADAIMFAQVSA